MGFFKDFKRDFAQAVNELMPESDSKSKKKKGEQSVSDWVEAEGVVEEEAPVTEIPEIPGTSDPMSEAVLREAADRLREELGRNIDAEAMRASEEIEAEIDNMPDAEDDWSADDYDDDDMDAAFADELSNIEKMQAEPESVEVTEETVETADEDKTEVLNGPDSAEETEDVQAEAGAAEEIAEPTAEKTEAVIDETESEEETPALKTIQEAVEEIVEEHAAETVEMISDISEEDKLEAERVASEVAMAEEERLIEEERLAAAEQHAAEEAELKRIAAEEKKADDKIVEEKKTEEKKTKRRSKAAAKTEAKTETAAPKRGTRKAKEEDRMPDLETEISRNDAYSGLSEDTTYITAKTVIVGNIETEDDIDVMGRVEGDINCQGKLIIGGRVNGNIRVTELYAHQAHIAGEIFAEGSVKIGAGTISVGNISAESAVIAGAVKGDVDVREQVIVDSSAVVVGNIRSKSIQVNAGAIVDGMCQQVYSDVNVDKFFDEEIEDLDGSTETKSEQAEEEVSQAVEVTAVEEVTDAEAVAGKISHDSSLTELESIESVTAEDEIEAEFEKSASGHHNQNKNRNKSSRKNGRR